MVVDFLRVPYRRSCRYTSTLLSTIEWSWCQEGAQFLPVPSVFQSRNWEDRSRHTKTTSQLGENYSEGTRWRKGTALSNATGQSYLGSPADWLGLGTDLSPPGPPVDGQGLPLACQGFTPDINAIVEVSFSEGTSLAFIPAPGSIATSVSVGFSAVSTLTSSTEWTAGAGLTFEASAQFSSSTDLTETAGLALTASANVELQTTFYAEVQLGITGSADAASSPPINAGAELAFEASAEWDEYQGVWASAELGIKFAGKGSLYPPPVGQVSLAVKGAAAMKLYPPPVGQVGIKLAVNGSFQTQTPV